jgi:hypothetical protein
VDQIHQSVGIDDNYVRDTHERRPSLWNAHRRR